MTRDTIVPGLETDTVKPLTVEEIDRWLTRRIDHSRRRLLDYLSGLADHCTTVTARLRRYSDDPYSVNSLGEVQTQGQRIDVECARYAALMELRAEIRAVQTASGETKHDT